MTDVFWSLAAEQTFQQEIDYILKKWSYKEVNNFISLVDSNLKQLEFSPLIGKVYDDSKRILVISKQTTLYYSYNDSNNTLKLNLFWNNQWNPKNLKKLL